MGMCASGRWKKGYLAAVANWRLVSSAFGKFNCSMLII